MAGIKVDPPPVNMQIIDMKTGRPTRPFIEFMHRLWQRTGGEVDAIEDLDVTNSYPVFKPTSASDAEIGQPSFLEGQKGASEEQINEAIQNLSALVHAKAPQPDVLDAIESLRAVTLSDMAGLHSEIGELREHVESLITLVMIIERPGRAASDAVSNHVALPDPHSQYADQANTYTETEVDNLLDDKADKATTYTETEVDGLLNTKADKANTYTETEVDELTGSLAYPSTTLASSSDIPESVKTAIAAYPHIQGFRTGTGAALTFAQVVEEAAELGARLLTIQELEAGVAAGAGFAYDTEITWTSSPAGVGLVYGNLGKGNGTRVVLNTNTDTAAGGYAVSVVGQRQWADTQYADQATTYTETEVDGLLDAKAAISGQAFSGNISAPNLSGTNTGDQTLSEIGVGQTWQDVSGSRAQNTNYTNSTGKPIMVSIVVANGSTDSGAIIVDSVGVGAESNAGLVPSQFIVPNGSVYLINSAGILAWSELR